MREINAGSSRKAKAAIEASIYNRTDVRVYPGRFLVEEPSAGRLPDVLGNGPEPLRQRARSGEGPALKQGGQLKWSRALSKKAASSIGQSNRSIDPEHPRLGVQQPRELPGSRRIAVPLEVNHN